MEKACCELFLPTFEDCLPATQVASLKEAANAEGADLCTAYNEQQGGLTAQQVKRNPLQSPHLSNNISGSDLG